MPRYFDHRAGHSVASGVKLIKQLAPDLERQVGPLQPRGLPGTRKGLRLVARTHPERASGKYRRGYDYEKTKPYKFQANPDFGEEYDIISKAAYFDYQQSKIYWRGKKLPGKSIMPAVGKTSQGIQTGKPDKANEVVIAKLLDRCPKCGSRKVYYLRKTMRSYLQTDIKFTRGGIRRHITVYRVNQGTCGGCKIKYSNAILRRMQLGDNLFAYITHLYINFHISSDLITKLIHDQFRSTFPSNPNM